MGAHEVVTKVPPVVQASGPGRIESTAGPCAGLAVLQMPGPFCRDGGKDAARPYGETRSTDFER